MAKTPLFSHLRLITAKALFGRRRGLTDPDAIEAAWQEALLSRRAFIGGTLGLGLGATLSAAGCGGQGDDTPTPTASASPSPSPSATPTPGARLQVAVVGGGLAGTHCAYRLMEAGATVSLFEASGRIGGRTFTGKGLFSEGQVCELGGELIDTNHATLWALRDEFGLTFDDRFADEPEGYRREIYWLDGAEVTEETLLTQMLAVSDKMAADVEAADSDDEAFETLDNTSLKDWLNANVPTETYAALHLALDIAYRGEYGLENTEQSCLNLLYLIGLDDPEAFYIFGDSDERYHCREGSDAFALKLAEGLGERIHLEHRVTQVDRDDAGVFTLHLDTAAGATTIEAEHIVFAMPFSVLRNIPLNIPLSDEKREIIDSLSYGTNAKVMSEYATRLWRVDHNASGAVTTDLGAQQSWSSSIGQAGTAGILTNFLGGEQGVACGEGTAEAWVQSVVIPDLEVVFPGLGDAYVSGSAQRMHWPSAPNALGSYTCYTKGQWAFWPLEGERQGNAHFCGEQCSADFQGWMEGAAESGALVAAEILEDYGAKLSAGHQRIVSAKAAAPQPCYRRAGAPPIRWASRHARIARTTEAARALGILPPRKA